MKSLFLNRKLYFIVAVLVIIAVLLMIRVVSKRDTVEYITATVDTGPVRQLVSVSGIAKAEQTAELSFPTDGIVEQVAVDTGDFVQEGDILIKLDARALYADRQDAAAAVAQAVANRDELLSGPTGSAREVTADTIIAKQKALATTKANEEQKVINAYRTLLSSDLTAYSNDPEEDAVSPTISGTYTCNTEGTYLLDVFSSASKSGYSYRLDGIETGTYVASIDQPTPIGECGLRILFDDSSRYHSTNWIIEIPNTKSDSDVTNRNAHALAVTQAESAISLAEQALLSAETAAINQNSPARSEAVTRANAAITQAEARLNRIDVTISDKILRAPFAGTVTELDILPGETVANAPVITLLASSDFEVTARIPEIDIGKLAIGQKTEMVFDARDDMVLTGEISFISLKETEIDGVSYYEAIIQLDEIPSWIRSGLNADIEIIISEQTDSLRVPKRFLIETENGHAVLLRKDGLTATSTIKVELEGNDGYIAITGLNEGDIIVAP